ncbi:DUF1127 domain-containing protein [Acidocella sp.]|uniref:DUF1127 domain-containing protein n=1 Tax=Acidocella sp. TaxID=50710 RepID=UPI003D030B4E
MSTTIHNQPVLSKLGSMAMTREAPAAVEPRGNKLSRWFKAWQARRAVAAELYAMTPRDLNDIGVARADIPAILRSIR